MIIDYEIIKEKDEKNTLLIQEENGKKTRVSFKDNDPVEDSVIHSNKMEYLRTKLHYLRESIKTIEKSNTLLKGTSILLGVACLLSSSYLVILPFTTLLLSTGSKALISVASLFGYAVLFSNIKQYKMGKRTINKMEKEVKYIEKEDIDIENKGENTYLIRKNNHKVSVNVDKIALDCENACNDIWYKLNKDTCIRKVEKARSTKKAYKELEKIYAPVTTNKKATDIYIREKVLKKER